jgi:hypothetical protein
VNESEAIGKQTQAGDKKPSTGLKPISVLTFPAFVTLIVKYFLIWKKSIQILG